MPACTNVRQPEGIEAFRHEVGRFLADAAVLEKIDFYLGRTKRTYISGKGIRFIGQLILDGKIGAVIDDDALRDADAGAMYNRESDCMIFKSTMFRTKAEAKADHEFNNKYAVTPIKQGKHNYFVRGKKTDHFVVHEAVHAWIDFRERNIYALRNETAAFLAAAVFMHHTGAMQLYTNTLAAYDPHQPIDASGATELELAVHIAATEGLFEPAGKIVRRAAYLPLLKKLAKGQYADVGRLERGSADGIPLDD